MNGALTIRVRIKPVDAEESKLRSLLDKIGGDIAGNAFIDFSALTTTHFLRWTILDQPPKPPEAPYPHELIFESNYDGPLDAHLDELVRAGGQTLDDIYGCCEGYPPPGKRSVAAITTFLKEHQIPHAVFFSGYPGRTLVEIKENTRANQLIRAYLEKNDVRLRRLQLPEVRQELLGHLDAAGVLKAPVAPLARTRLTGLAERIYARPKAALKVLVVIGVLLLPLGLALLAAFEIFMMVLHRHEREEEVKRRVADSAPSGLAERENHTAQNPVTHLVRIKPGRFRHGVLRGALWIVNFLSQHLFIRGMLGPITTIHHARWVLLEDEDRDRSRLLFMSNYDGTWEHYLSEFVDLARLGLNAIWSNTCEFPRARSLVLEGAADEDGFKQWALNHQLPVQVWYTAHADETVKNILSNVAIRRDLRDPVCGALLGEWFKRL